MRARIALAIVLLAVPASGERVPLVCDPELGGSSAGVMVGELFGHSADSFTACEPGPSWDRIASDEEAGDDSYLYGLFFRSDGTSITAELEVALAITSVLDPYLTVSGVASAEFVAPSGLRAYQSLVIEVERSGILERPASVRLGGPADDFGIQVIVGELPDGLSEIPLEPGETYRLVVSAGATLEENGAGTATVVAAVDVPEPHSALALALGALILGAFARVRAA